MGARACAVGLPAVAPGSDWRPSVPGGRRVFLLLGEALANRVDGSTERQREAGCQAHGD